MAKKKKKTKPTRQLLRFLIVTVLLAFLTYKYQSAQPDASDRLPQTATSVSSAGPGEALEIPVMTPKAGGQLLKRTGYTLSYDAGHKTPQWVRGN